MFKAISLFSGCGGADLGLLGGFNYIDAFYPQNPFEIIYATDIDQKALNSYKQNFNSHSIVCEDVRNIDSQSIPEHDILLGGFSMSVIQHSKSY